MPLIVHPHLHLRRTGVTAHVESVVRALADAGIDARAWGANLSASTPAAGLWEVLRAARRGAVVWHAHRNNELALGLLLRALFGVRVVYTRHSAAPPGAYTRFLYQRADRVVALTDEVARMLAAPAEVVGHGVDLGRFTPPEDRALAWRSLGIGGDRGVGVVGRIRPEKGQGDFVDAVAPLLASHPRWQGVLVGHAKPEHRAWADELASRAFGRVSLVGEQQDSAPWFRGLTIVVQPSHSEGFSLVLLEAMASGCCVVAAHLPHFGALVDHGRTGFLYPVGDRTALKRTLASLMDDPARAEAVGRAAAEEAQERFGVDREAARLLALYRSLSPALSAGM